VSPGGDRDLEGYPCRLRRNIDDHDGSEKCPTAIRTVIRVAADEPMHLRGLSHASISGDKPAGHAPIARLAHQRIENVAQVLTTVVLNEQILGYHAHARLDIDGGKAL
jgi:hypothetical protein